MCISMCNNKQCYIGHYLDKADYQCTPGYQVNSGIEGDTRVILEYSFTCGANNDWKDAHSPQQCVKQSCGDPGGFTMKVWNRCDVAVF